MNIYFEFYEIMVAGLYRFLSPKDRMGIAFGTIGGAINGSIFSYLTIPFGSLISILSGYMYGKYTSQEDLEKQIVDILLPIVGVAGLALLSKFISKLCLISVTENVVLKIRQGYFSSILRRDIAWADDQNAGELISRYTKYVFTFTLEWSSYSHYSCHAYVL